MDALRLSTENEQGKEVKKVAGSHYIIPYELAIHLTPESATSLQNNNISSHFVSPP